MTGPSVEEVVILSPLALPATGGAAIYTDILARHLIARNVTRRVTLLTEAHPDAPSSEQHDGGRRLIRRVFPYRASCPTRQRDRHWRYLVQNFGFARYLRRAWSPRSILLVHGSFLIHPCSLDWLLPALRRRRPGPALIADLRDPRLPPSRFRRLAPFDRIISCGEAVTRHVTTDTRTASRLHEIPIPFEAPNRPPDADAIAAGYGLTPGRFVLWPNGLLARKGLAPAIEAVRRLRERGEAGVTLAVTGPARDLDGQSRRAMAVGDLRYLGPLPHDRLIALATAAGVVLFLSEIEGLPRSALEAIAVGARVLLPPGVPEFARHCPECIPATADPAALAATITDTLYTHSPVADYPLDRHAPEIVTPAYRAVFEAALRNA
mgnify:CR=1 FL=1